MKKKKSRLNLAQEKLEEALNRTNKQIEVLGAHTASLHDELCNIQNHFDKIRDIPSENKIQYEKFKQIRLSWKQQVEKIEKDYRAKEAKGAGGGTAVAGAGVAVAALGPTVAMGIATTFGMASTGTAISTLSGAAATNAALAWLGGGALAAGGGGMAAGHVLLALAGPVGWAIAGISILVSGVIILMTFDEKRRLEDIFSLISERDSKRYDLATVELNERIKRIIEESNLIANANEKIKTFGLDYLQMTEGQQYELGAYVNLMISSTQLLVNPILGLQPNFTEEDYNVFENEREISKQLEISKNAYKELVIGFANLFYKIEVDEKDQKLLWKSFRGNKKFLKAVGIDKKNFAYSIIEVTFIFLTKKNLYPAILQGV